MSQNISQSIKDIPNSYTTKMNSSCLDFTKLGFRPSTDREIAGGNPPFVFDIYKHDTPVCSTAKSQFNYATKELFDANQDYLHPLEPFIQAMTLKHTADYSMKTIATHCVPKNYKL
jgi:hypothetical protein